MSPSRQPVVAGILGGIGSGKSAVARGLAEQFRGVLIDADRIGHQVLKFPEVILQIRQAFGDTVFDGDQIDRRRLASEVFGDHPDRQRSRRLLEQIVHPEIDRVVQSQLATAGSADLVLLDAAVMLEAGWNRHCDFLIFVDTPLEDRVRRVREQRNWTESELQQRESSQLPIEEKRSAADFIVDNSGTLDQAIRQAAGFISGRLSSLK